MRREAGFAFALLSLAAAGCGTREVLPDEVAVSVGTGGLCYVWQAGDSWRFLAWAIMDSEEGEGFEALALTSGWSPSGPFPAPGDTVRLPLEPSLGPALDSRLEAARLVRLATQEADSGRTDAAVRLLRDAIGKDPGWSVPAYDLALLLTERGDMEGAEEVLEPVAHKPRAALVLARIAWEHGDAEGALRHLETALLSDDPPGEALAAAALAYTMTGNTSQASRLWLRLLQDPGAESALRLMAVLYSLEIED